MSIGSNFAFNTRMNAQAGTMGIASSMMGMLANPCAFSPEQALTTEKNLMMQKLNFGTLGKAAGYMEESQEKLIDENMKSFNYMA